MRLHLKVIGVSAAWTTVRAEGMCSGRSQRGRCSIDPDLTAAYAELSCSVMARPTDHPATTYLRHH
jgi:hypothetical protein